MARESLQIEFEDPTKYFLNTPLHMAIFAKNGVGKTTFAGTTGLRTILLDCSDSGAVTLRKVKSNLKIVRVRSIAHYLEIISKVIKMADNLDLLVPDTFTGLQSLAIREVKGKGQFDMNQKKWGQVGSRMIECIAETRNFPKNVIYLVQEKKKGGGEEGADEIMPGLTPSVKSYLSSCVDWVGYLKVGEDSKRFLDFRITENLEVKDRANIFPKLISNPTYLGVRNRIMNQLKETTDVEKS